MTGVLDRLERAGYARRVRDPHDRRRVLVELTQPFAPDHQWIWQRLRNAVADVAEPFTTDELAAVARYLGRVVAAMRREAAVLPPDEECGPVG